MLSVSNLQTNVGNTNYYSAGFRTLIEDHLSYIRKHNSTRIIQLEAIKELVYRGSFFSLLDYLKISQDLWWIVMRVNGIHNETNYLEPITHLILPDRSLINVLNQRFMNTRIG